jgi:hypothetical protein
MISMIGGFPIGNDGEGVKHGCPVLQGLWHLWQILGDCLFSEVGKGSQPCKYCSGCMTLSAADAMAAGLAMALRIFLEEGPFNDADMSGSDRCYGIGEFDCRNPHLVRSHLVSLLIPCRRYIYASGS